MRPRFTLNAVRAVCQFNIARFGTTFVYSGERQPHFRDGKCPRLELQGFSEGHAVTPVMAHPLPSVAFTDQACQVLRLPPRMVLW
jgi:hypothetical protein